MTRNHQIMPSTALLLFLSFLANNFILLAQSSRRSSDGGKMQIIFSSGCDDYQTWQSISLMYSVALVQEDPVTRIVSGCSARQMIQLRRVTKRLFPKYDIYFTPNYDQNNYVYYNKPYGIQHWLNNTKIDSETIIIILDPDMIVLRPFTTKISKQSNLLYSSNLQPSEIIDEVKIGHPVAQQYGIDAPWAYESKPTINRTEVCGHSSPCLQVTYSEAIKKYSIGPPYIIAFKDLKTISENWITFSKNILNRQEEHLAEMYGYAMSSAHSHLPHLQLDHFMISNTIAYGEGWKFIDKIFNYTCPFPVIKPRPSTTKSKIKPPFALFYPGHDLPNVLHYCQEYTLGRFRFYKTDFHNDRLLTCPPRRLPDLPKVLGHIDSEGIRSKAGEKPTIQTSKRNGFALCVAHRYINAALDYYERKICHQKPKEK